MKEKKVKDQIRKTLSRKKYPRRLVRVAKIAFSLEKLYGMTIWTEFGRTSFVGFFFKCLFFLGQGENTPGKKTPQTGLIKIQVNSGEIPVLKNLGQMIRNVDSHSLTPKSA